MLQYLSPGLQNMPARFRVSLACDACMAIYCSAGQLSQPYLALPIDASLRCYVCISRCLPLVKASPQIASLTREARLCMQACITVNSAPQSQEARLAALVELQRLRTAAAQRRLRRAVSAEAELQAQAAPTVLADWTAWRRVAPGAPDLAPPPRPPPPPPRVPPPAAEVAALQTEMSRCGVQLD